MSPTLREDIRQNKPFTTVYEEAFLNVARTSARMSDTVEDLLKGYGITGTQYNVLRILRGAEPGGLCRNELRNRMIARMPDMTRLLDRMEEAGLVTRTREREDRRMVLTRITARGLEILDELDAQISANHKAQLGHLTTAQLRSLIDLLTAARNKA